MLWFANAIFLVVAFCLVANAEDEGRGFQLTSSCNLTSSQICDGRNDCGDWSDEKNCPCPHDKFECNCYKTGCPLAKNSSAGRECIERSKVSDGHADCSDGSDERNCTNHENNVICGCLQEGAECTEPGRCIPSSWVGDGKPDCDDGSDEPCMTTKDSSSTCRVTFNRCSAEKDKSVILQFMQDNTTTCTNISKPCGKSHMCQEWICTSSNCTGRREMFHCDNQEIVLNERFCDGTSHCDDESDEQEQGLGFRCSGKSKTRECLLPQKNLYDSTAQCADDSDLCFVGGKFKCFLCMDRKHIIAPHQVCDGVVDCYDMSDECFCKNKSVCNTIKGNEVSQCPPNQMHCHNSTDCRDTESVLCNAGVRCANDINLRFCSKPGEADDFIYCENNNDSLPTRARKCDGRPECSDLRDECACDPLPSFCSNECTATYSKLMKGHEVCDGMITDENDACSMQMERDCPMRFYCKSKGLISIDRQSVCDGIVDCDDGSDENRTLCNDRSFFCPRGDAVSIHINLTCDGVTDCDDGEDESKDLCMKKRFYCENGSPLSIKREFLSNGVRDCSDGSDEIRHFISDRYEMISNSFLRALFWIMAILALLGNLFVHITTLKNVRIGKQSSLKLAHSIFILNLTVSDFLMGVYLLALVIQSFQYSGKYCAFDKPWRSSKLCSRLGALALVSSETSAFLMAAISTLRLVTVNRPFSFMICRKRWIFLSSLMCWTLSIVLAAIPLLSYTSNYFTAEVWFPNYFFETATPSKIDVLGLAKALLSKDANANVETLRDARRIIEQEIPYHSFKGEFGYYSKTSICMPRLYASTAEAAWPYSTFIVTLNFVLFLWMVICYVVIYKRSNRMKRSRSGRKNMPTHVQKRISRLLVTDFCCWIPVCVMGYLSLGGVHLPSNAYVATAGVLLPINSALNPILYSKSIGKLIRKVKARIRYKIPRGFSVSSKDVDSASQTCTTGKELPVVTTTSMTLSRQSN